MPAARALALPFFSGRPEIVFDSLVARRRPAGAESARQRPQPVVVCRSTIHKFANHFCTIFSAFAVRFRCLSTTYDQELHQWCKSNVSPTLDFGLWTRNSELCRSRTNAG